MTRARPPLLLAILPPVPIAVCLLGLELSAEWRWISYDPALVATIVALLAGPLIAIAVTRSLGWGVGLQMLVALGCVLPFNLFTRPIWGYAQLQRADSRWLSLLSVASLRLRSLKGRWLAPGAWATPWRCSQASAG